MNSSTSSSKREWKVILTVLMVLGACEMAIRALEPRLSKDVAHMMSFEEIASELAQESEKGRETILFLGNSMTRDGVDVDVFRERIVSNTSAPHHVARIMPDNTALSDWYYVYKRFFVEKEIYPDVLIIGFRVGHLRDAPSNHPKRLARFYCGWSGVREVFENDFKGFADRVDYVLSTVSVLYSSTDRLQRRTLDMVIPSYRTAANQINDYMVTEGKGSLDEEPTFDRLRHMVQMVQSKHTKLILSAMPIASPYELPAAIESIAGELGVPFVDCRSIEGITPDLFPDGLHMNQVAAAVYSEYLGNQIAPLLSNKRYTSASTSENRPVVFTQGTPAMGPAQ